MFKHACVIGVVVGSIGSLALSRGGDADPARSATRLPQPRQEAAIESAIVPAVAPTAPVQRVADRTEPDSLVEALGLAVKPVPAELAAHLGLEAGSGLLITRVEAGSRAEAAGLAAHDVITEIDAEPARISLLDAAQDGEKGLALDVIRSGVEARVAVPAASAPDGFLSTAHLGPDHPFRRLAELDELKQSYSEKADSYSQRMRELDERSREAREEAKRQVAALQEACDEEVAAFLAERQAELLARVEERMSEETLAPLHGLAIDLEALVPAERIQGTDETLGELEQFLRKGLTERLELDDQGSDELVNRARNRFNNLQNEAGNLMAERVQRPWSQHIKSVEKSRNRFGKQFSERMQWTDKTLGQIRVKVGERIVCAFERTQEEFSKKLGRRLDQMEVPQPGEVEAVMADMVAQIETMTDRFIRRTEFALNLYLTEMEEGNDELVAGLQANFPACEAAATTLDATVRQLVQSELEGEPLVIDATWNTRTRLDDRYDTLREQLRVALNDGRNDMRVGSVGLDQNLEEHGRVSEDSWRDLQQLLGEILGNAQSDCWKLDGPHLDGRFPAPRVNEGAKGEVVFAR